MSYQCADTVCTHTRLEHHLLHCDRLVELRENLLPPNHSIENCLYSSAKQLRKTYIPHSGIKSLRGQRRESLIIIENYYII